MNTTPNKATKFYIIILIIAATAVYFKSTSYDLIYLDDNKFVKDNYELYEDFSNLPKLFTETFGPSYYRPLLAFSFMVDTNVAGQNPTFFRLTNLALHIVAFLLIFNFLNKFKFKQFNIFMLCLLLLLHPVLTPSVAWISARNDTLLTIFIVSSFLFLINSYYEEKNWPINISLHLLFYFFALFTKEIGVMLPLTSAVYLFYFKRNNLPKNKVIVHGVGLAVITVIWFIMRNNALSGAEGGDMIGISAFLKNFPVLFALPGKFIAPFKMSALAPIEWFSIISGAIFWSVLIIFTKKSEKYDKKIYSFGFIWFFLFLLPSLLVRIADVEDFFDYAEHRAFLPIVGIALIVLELLRSNKINLRKRPAFYIISALIILFTVKSFTYQEVFENRLTYWKNFTSLYPYKSRGYWDLALAYSYFDMKKEEEQALKKCIMLNPKNMHAYMKMGVLYREMGKMDQAEKLLLAGIKREPEYPDYYVELAAIYAYKKQYNREIQVRERLKSIMKKFNAPMETAESNFIKLGLAYYKIENYEKSIENYKYAMQIDPNEAKIISNLAASYFKNKQMEEAIKLWHKAIELNPSHLDAYSNLLQYYVNTGQAANAKKMAELLQKNGGQIPAFIKEKFNKLVYSN